MKTKFIIIIIAFSATGVFAQTDSLIFKKDIDNLYEKGSLLESKIETIQAVNIKILQENNTIKNSQSVLRKNYNQLNNGFETYKQNAEKKIDSLKQIINTNATNIKITADELGIKIEDTQQRSNQSIIDLNKTVSQNKFYWIIAILAVALIGLLLFNLLRKQIFKQKTDLDSNLTNLYNNLQETRKVLEEEGVKVDSKLIEVLETQLKIIDSSSTVIEKEANHTLALKVADEIIRIQKNLTRMDENTKGLKQLISSVKRIQDNFASNGYELVEMLGKQYNDGMKASVNFIPDEDLEKGKQVISRIIKPQVNYNGVMIQTAQIEVSQGE